MNTFLDDRLDLVLLDPAMQAQPQDLLVLNVVICLRVLLEDRRVRRHDLEPVFLLFLILVLIFSIFVLIADIAQIVERYLILFLNLLHQRLWKSNDHGTTILDNVHCLRVQNRNQNEGIGTLEYLHGTLDGLK